MPNPNQQPWWMPWLAPGVVVGVVGCLASSVFSGIWFEARQATNLTNLTADVSALRRDGDIKRREFASVVKDQLDEIKAGISKQHDNDETDRRDNQAQYNALNATLNRIAGQLSFMLVNIPKDKP